jgi:GT2 family glycosyltransferase
MVVPTLGQRPDHLRECLASITSQEVAGVDLVLVAPESPDLEAVAREYAARTVPDPGRGISGALNAGFAAGVPGTAYVGWLGDDDLLRPGSLAATTAALDADSEASMAYGWCDYVDSTGTTLFSSRAGRLAARIITFAPNLIPQPGCLMRLADVQAVGGVDEDLKLSMDLDLFLKLRRRGHLLAVPQTLASFRWHESSATFRSQAASAEEADQVRMRYLPASAARLYRVGRWPGRAALQLMRWRVSRRARGATASYDG